VNTASKSAPRGRSRAAAFHGSIYTAWHWKKMGRISTGCKACYDNGTAKVLVATSTTSCIKHLATHGFYPPGTQPPNAGADGTVDAWVEGVHPLQAERWRESFIDWITHDDITFEQAASPRLRRVIISGCPSVQHLLPSARTVRA
jgi:hypothetical protein